MERINDVERPSWLNSSFISKILSEDKPTTISVSKIDVTPAVPKGENFMSTLYRVYVQYKESTHEEFLCKHLIIKCQSPEEDLQEFLQRIKAFEKEVHMFENIFPMMKDVIVSKSGRSYEFSAKYFRTERPNTIVLEDLNHLGYKMEDRLKGLDLEHCFQVVKSLARFHGLSKKLEKIDPAVTNIFGKGFYVKTEKEMEMTGPYFKAKMLRLASEVETWPSYEHYAEKIRKLSSKAVELMFDCAAPKVGSFNVLNHADCWVNNLLFRHCPQTGRVLDVKLLDFQFSTISSPAFDLQYFFATSCADDVRYDHREELLELYHAELVETLKAAELDPDQYTLQDLKEDFAEKDIYGLIVGCFDLSGFLRDRSDERESSEGV
ncbi:hypothetical protein C0J52_28343 [Blattella germanica]|nr:hypothetical protein C0J52_28343 [Blattella germanica]